MRVFKALRYSMQGLRAAVQHEAAFRQELALGLIEGLCKLLYAEASAVVIFVIMIIVLLVRPAGLFGKQA